MIKHKEKICKEVSKLYREVLQNIFLIEVPLPRNPLKALNAYVMKGPQRNLIIDTGMNREECRSVMFKALDELKIDLNKTDFFLTHMHADHSGLISALATATSSIYCSGPDADIINNMDSWDRVLYAAGQNGFPREELQDALHKHPGYKYSSSGHINFSIVKDGDPISIGDYNFRCVATPGHTEGHMCLYDQRAGILVSGDHILDDITPNISQHSDDEGSLSNYLASLDKVYQLDVGLTLPGHRKLIKDHKARIVELRQHHQLRLAEVVDILERASGDAYSVAAQMKWDINCASWQQFPTPQKWFATGEAIAHLMYLEEKGQVKREIKDQIYVFSLL